MKSMKFPCKWMVMEIIILREVTQNQKDRHCMLFTLTWGIIDDTAFPPNIAYKFKKPVTGKGYLF